MANSTIFKCPHCGKPAQSIILGPGGPSAGFCEPCQATWPSEHRPMHGTIKGDAPRVHMGSFLGIFRGQR